MTIQMLMKKTMKIFSQLMVERMEKYYLLMSSRSVLFLDLSVEEIHFRLWSNRVGHNYKNIDLIQKILIS